jgi:hypothetical protein
VGGLVEIENPNKPPQYFAANVEQLVGVETKAILAFGVINRGMSECFGNGQTEVAKHQVNH